MCLWLLRGWSTHSLVTILGIWCHVWCWLSSFWLRRWLAIGARWCMHIMLIGSTTTTPIILKFIFGGPDPHCLIIILLRMYRRLKFNLSLPYHLRMMWYLSQDQTLPLMTLRLFFLFWFPNDRCYPSLMHYHLGLVDCLWLDGCLEGGTISGGFG